MGNLIDLERRNGRDTVHANRAQSRTAGPPTSCARCGASLRFATSRRATFQCGSVASLMWLADEHGWRTTKLCPALDGDGAGSADDAHRTPRSTPPTAAASSPMLCGSIAALRRLVAIHGPHVTVASIIAQRA